MRSILKALPFFVAVLLAGQPVSAKDKPKASSKSESAFDEMDKEIADEPAKDAANEQDRRRTDTWVFVSERDPKRGAEKSNVSFVEFGAYQCRQCGIFERETLPKIWAAYKDRVTFYFKDFPMEFRQNDEPAARAAQCAHEQGKFWAYHDTLFANREKLDEKSLYRYAKGQGLDEEKFDDCFENDDTKAKVEADRQDGLHNKVMGTPTFYVNGTMIVGNQPFEVFQKAIDKALAESPAYLKKNHEE